jgi:hypothetical protein
MKKVMFIFCGLCWFVFGLGFGAFLLLYLFGGAGLQEFSFGIFIPTISSGSVLIGLVHVVGLFMLSLLCFVIGIGLCSHGFECRRDHGGHVTESTKQ